MDSKRFNFVIVDDYEEARKALVEILESQFKGSFFFRFADGLEAKRWLEGVGNPDNNVIVITDLEMPHMDGESLVRFIRENPKLREIPVVMVSGYAGIKEIAESWGCRFLHKPFQLKEFLGIISEFIKEKI